MTKKIMTVGDLLAWAYEERQVAESLEQMKSQLPEEIHPSLDKQIQIRRERSAWLDERVDALIGLDEYTTDSGG